MSVDALAHPFRSQAYDAGSLHSVNIRIGIIARFVQIANKVVLTEVIKRANEVRFGLDCGEDA